MHVGAVTLAFLAAAGALLVATGWGVGPVRSLFYYGGVFALVLALLALLRRYLRLRAGANKEKS